MSPKRLAFIDHIRGFAILGVFLFHALTANDKLFFSGWMRDFSDLRRTLFLPLNLGWLGVAMFFVVSGFCIHVSFQQQGRSWKGFFVRRFFRLFPPYLAALLFFAFVLPYSRLHFGTDEWAGWNLINHLFLVHNFHPRTYWGINSSFWSIAVEVQLYLLYPVLVYVAGRHGWRRSLWLAGICELAICAAKTVMPLSISTERLGAYEWAGFFLENISGLGHTPLAFWLSWGMGAVLAESYLQGKANILAKVPPAVSLSLVLACFLLRDLSSFLFVAAAFATAVIMARLLEKERIGLVIPKWLEPLRYLGIYSYSLYLLHQPLMYAITRNASPWLNLEDHPLAHYLVSISTIVFIFPLSYLSFQFLEQPSIQWGKRVVQSLDRRTCPSPVKMGSKLKG